MYPTGPKIIALLLVLAASLALAPYFLRHQGNDALILAESLSFQEALLDHCSRAVATSSTAHDPQTPHPLADQEAARTLREACLSAWQRIKWISSPYQQETSLDVDAFLRQLEEQLGHAKSQWQAALMEESKRTMHELYLAVAFADLAAPVAMTWNGWLEDLEDDEPLVSELDDLLRDVTGELEIPDADATTEDADAADSDAHCQFDAFGPTTTARLSTLQNTWRVEYQEARRAQLLRLIEAAGPLHGTMRDPWRYLDTWDAGMREPDIDDEDSFWFISFLSDSLRERLMREIDALDSSQASSWDQRMEEVSESFSRIETDFANWHDTWEHRALQSLKGILEGILVDLLDVFMQCPKFEAQRQQAHEESQKLLSQLRESAPLPHALESFWQDVHGNLATEHPLDPSSSPRLRTHGLNVRLLLLDKALGRESQLAHHSADLRSAYLLESRHVLRHTLETLLIGRGFSPATAQRQAQRVDSLWASAEVTSNRQAEILVASRQKDLEQFTDMPQSYRFEDPTTAQTFFESLSTFLETPEGSSEGSSTKAPQWRLQAVARALSQGFEIHARSDSWKPFRKISTEATDAWRALVTHHHRALAQIRPIEERMEQRYGIRILHDALRNADFDVRTSSYTTDLAPLSRVQESLRQLEHNFLEYPHFMIRDSGLRHLHLAFDVREKGRFIGLGGFRVADSIFLDLGSHVLDTEVADSPFEFLGHELFHQLDQRTSQRDELWTRLAVTRSVTRFHSVISVDDKAAYARSYGREAPWEDRATIAEALLRHDRIHDLLMRCRNHDGLRRKVEVITGCKFDASAARFQRLLTLVEYQELFGKDSWDEYVVRDFDYFRKWSTDSEGVVWMDSAYWNALADWRHVRFEEDSGKTARFIDGQRSVPSG